MRCNLICCPNQRGILMLFLTLLSIVVVMLVLRQSIALILFVGLAYLHLTFGDGNLTYIIADIWSSLDSEILLPIPLFILAGGIMIHGTITA